MEFKSGTHVCTLYSTRTTAWVMTAASTTSHTHWVACDVALQTRDLFGRVGLTPMEDGVLIHFSESLDLTQYPCQCLRGHTKSCTQCPYLPKIFRESAPRTHDARDRSAMRHTPECRPGLVKSTMEKNSSRSFCMGVPDSRTRRLGGVIVSDWDACSTGKAASPQHLTLVFHARAPGTT